MNTVILTTITIASCIIGEILLLSEETEKNKKYYIYQVLCMAGVAAIAVAMQVFYSDMDFLQNLRLVSLCGIIWPIALIDQRTMRIPNKFIIAALIVWVIYLPVQLLVDDSDMGYFFLQRAIAIGVLLLASLLCCLMIKNALGAGDIKLFIVLGLYLGKEGLWAAMFCSLLISFVIAVVLLLTKRLKRKDTMPFGPSLMIGTLLSIFLTGR